MVIFIPKFIYQIKIFEEIINMTTIVKCPTCRADVAWLPENTYRPFCSERCKMIDLGAWADEQHVITGSPSLEGFDDV